MKQCPAELLCAHGYPGSSCGCYVREVKPTQQLATHYNEDNPTRDGCPYTD